MKVAHRVQQPGELRLTGLDNARICVAGGGDAERGGQIQIFFPSASQTKTSLARSQTMGHEPSGSMLRTFRDSKSRNKCKTFVSFHASKRLVVPAAR